MLRKRLSPPLIAGCILVAACETAATAAFAADLTLAAAARPSRGKLAQMEKARLAEKERHRKILTYSLFQDPLFRLDGAADKRRFDMANRVNGLGSGLGNTVSPLPASGTVNTPSRAASETAPVADNSGIAFGCRERPFGSSALRRELTACFRHNVDKSWKAQTYVSRGYADGNQNWGGGLSLAYAY